MNGISFETALIITCLIVGVPALAARLAQLWGWWAPLPTSSGSAATSWRTASIKMEGQLKELKGNLRTGLKTLNRLGPRLDKTEGQLKELKGGRRRGLKGLRMSLDGVRKYYGVQRRLVEQRLVALEVRRDGTETEAPAGDGSGYPGTRSVAAGTGFPGKPTDPPLSE